MGHFLVALFVGGPTVVGIASMIYDLAHEKKPDKPKPAEPEDHGPGVSIVTGDISVGRDLNIGDKS